MKLLLVFIQIGLTLAEPSANTNCNFPSKGTPTVIPAVPFDAGKDAEGLFKAMDGLGTKEDVIIDILGKRSLDQRLEIAEQYKTLHGQDLYDALESDMSGDFGSAVLALMLPHPHLYAKELHDAVTRSGDSGALIEILTTLQVCAKHLVLDAYKQQYGVALKDDLKNHISDQELRNHLVTLATVDRDEGLPADPKTQNLDKDMDSKSHFFAERLHDAMNGPGTNERALTRIIVAHSETDLGDIKEDYQQMYGTSLKDDIADDTSGDYKRLLLLLVA